MKIEFESIGIIHTPYEHHAPFQPVENAKGNFYIDINEKFKDGLEELKTFSHIYVLFILHKSGRSSQMKVSPPWINHSVGVFSTRSPRRPNGIGLSIVKLKKNRKHETLYFWDRCFLRNTFT